MRAHRSTRGWVGRKVTAIIVLALAAALVALTLEGSRSHAAAQGPSKLEATIFSYDGKDFVRTKTTLTDEQGKSAANTKLDHNSLAYKALVKKHSYVGPSTVFGKKYDAEYAPILSDDGKLTGALFVATTK
ncbi:MAG TPA: Cache 3/Cache 2 fusion domain-containing protein [Gemmatimonadales bacterium]|nr:Cache 3/Cache 2 fusion domain-containing protein [Gemmatimonadales bacterium]